MSFESLRVRRWLQTLSVVALALSLPLVSGGEEFLDDFEDGSVHDGEPCSWEFHPQTPGDDSVVDRKLVIGCPGCDVGDVVVFRPVCAFFEGAVVASAEFRVRGLGDFGVIVHGQPDFVAYVGVLRASGEVEIVRVRVKDEPNDEPNDSLARAFTEFLPGSSYRIELVVADSGLELRVWPAGAERPGGPLLQATENCSLDPCYRSGLAGLGLQVREAGGAVEAAVEYFEVREAVVSQFVRGDCNDDGAVDISDAVSTLGTLFLGQGEITCEDACDSNDDGAVNISDAIATLGVLFLGNGTIPLPGMEQCGVDPTNDEMGCDAFERCP